MTLITGHWSATPVASPPQVLGAYHEEFAANGPLSETYLHALRIAHDTPNGYKLVDWQKLFSYFTTWKNDSFTTMTDYGTWDINTDPRDGSPNIEVAALCMGGSDVSVAGSWGSWPYTMAHAWMHVAIIARICAIKNIDVLESFPVSVEPGTLQNGPIFTVSTHGERAIQTINYGVPGAGASSLALSQEFGYYPGSGDPNSRCDLYLLDSTLVTGQVTVLRAHTSAMWLRQAAHAVKVQGFAPNDPLMKLLAA